jgi:hypothetical protein
MISLGPVVQACLHQQTSPFFGLKISPPLQAKPLIMAQLLGRVKHFFQLFLIPAASLHSGA